MYKHSMNNERGMAALVALIMVGMLTLIGLAALSTSDDEVAISGNTLQETRAFYAAEAGLERAAAALQTEYETTGAPPVTMPSGTDVLNKCNVAYRAVDNGPAKQDRVKSGSMVGLHALVKSFSLASVATSQVDKSQVRVEQTFETNMIPLYQFAVFYDEDLEIAPGPDMSLLGRVHSNGNLYIQANNTLDMDSYVTAAGQILHGRKGPGVVGAGDVRVKDAVGNYVSMKSGANWVDNTFTNWYDTSVARWNGRVQDEEHGQSALNVPLLGGATDPHDMIEREAGNPNSYEAKATLKFINNQAFQKIGGLWVNVTAAMVADGVITYSPDKFRDYRDNELVDCTDLDISKMYDEGYAPANGVIYFSDNDGGAGEFPALRITNGTELDAPLTIASENPVYTLGNFNSNATKKKPAAILCDALTFLSGSWSDNLALVNKADRVASNTTVNCAYVTGNKATTGTVYNGGYENLPRFLETWTGKTMSWKGSAINLWYSVQALGDWSGAYYDPPNRNWSYDVDLDDPNKLPPESPVIRVFHKIGWSQEHVGFDAQNYVGP